MPARFASAIINLDYTGLDKDDIKNLNNDLLNNNLLFSDCLNCGDEYIGKYNGITDLIIDYSFK